MITLYVLCALIIASTVMVYYFRNLFHALLSLLFMSTFIGMLFLLFKAYLVGVFQLAIYSGAITILFLAILFFVREKEERYGLKMIVSGLILAFIVLILAFLAFKGFIYPHYAVRGENIPLILWRDMALILILQALILFSSILCVLFIVRERVLK